jgi:hypothetical protein
LSKINATLPPAYIDYLDRIRNRMDVGPAPRKDYTRLGPIITELNRAIVDEKKIRMVYFSMGRQKESRRTVHPYRLRHVEDTLYLIGYCTLRKGVRTFAVDRIKTIAVGDDGFHIPQEFDLQAFLQDSFGIYQGPPVTVKIRFFKSVAGYIRERIWHPSQHLSDEADGAVLFTATVAGIEEISHWVLRWGAGAQVLAPEALRQTVRRHASAMLSHYRDAPADDGPTSILANPIPTEIQPMTISSKLPDVGTTIFSVMSALAAEHGAINLSQGFPDFDTPPALIDRVATHMRDGRNQYAPMQGVALLRERIAAKVADLYGNPVDPETEITVTSGATEALYAAITAVVRPGDEVVVFEPAFDSYVPAIRLNGGTPGVPLHEISRLSHRLG